MLHKVKILIVLLLSLTVISCSDSIVNNPLIEQTGTESLSEKGNFERGNPVTTITQRINGETGGVIYLTGLHIGPNLSVITMSATLTIPPGAFEGETDITLTADYETPGIICEPDMEFSIPLELDLLYIGLDLFALQLFPGQVDFGYIGGKDVVFEPCEYDGIDINLLAGLLGVRKARLHHFSRYGYSR